MPNMASTELSVTVSLDDSATMDDTIDAAQNLLDTLSKYDEFETVGVMTGSTTSLMGLTGSVSSSDADKGSVMAYAVFKDDKVKNSESISKEIEAELQSIDGDVVVSGSSSSSSMSAMLGDDGVSIKLYGDDLKTLQNTAKDMAEKLAAVDGIDETDNGIGATSGEIKVTVDKTKAAKKSLTVAQVYQLVSAKMADSKSATTISTDIKDYKVYVQTQEQTDTKLDDIRQMTFTHTDKDGKEKEIPLTKICEMKDTTTLSTMKRDAQTRYITVSCGVDEDHNVTLLGNKIQKSMDKLNVPEGYHIEMTGEDETISDSMSQLVLMMILAVIFIYLIMVVQFQSLVSPFIIMFSIPLAFTGGFIALLLTGQEVNVLAMLGFIMLAGLIVNNGIVLIDYINQARKAGVSKHEAIISSGKTRVRPILMTVLTTVLAMLTTALGIGDGSDMMRPMAITLIGGLVYGTVLTLIVIPCIYDMFHREKNMVEEEL